MVQFTLPFEFCSLKNRILSKQKVSSCSISSPIMDSNPSGSEFGFSFNDANFSDRLLRLEISGCADVSGSSVIDLVRLRKRKRDDLNIESSTNGVLNLNSYHNNKNKEHEEAVLIGQEGTQAVATDHYENETYWKDNGPLVLRVKELHISSLLLAAKSPYFYKLFSNGMSESKQSHVTLRIHASEEVAVMELLKFMYTGSLTVTTAPEVLEVLMAADKYEVALCMKHCSSLLSKMPMTQDIALLLLELPSSIQAAASVEPLIDTSRKFIACRYQNMSKLQEKELMALPLVGMEAVLASDDLQVNSEDKLYEFVLQWAKTHYSVLEQRQDILGSHLARFIRFPHMSCQRLKKILDSDDFTDSVKTSLVLKALFFKADSNHYYQCSRTAKRLGPLSDPLYVGRAYKYRPIRVMTFESPRQQCVVYLDLTYKECMELYPSGRLYSAPFDLGGHYVYLVAHCSITAQQNMYGMFFGIQESGSEGLSVEYELLARMKPTEEFVGKYKGKHKFTGEKSVRYNTLYGVQWEDFMSQHGPYFINDVVHVQAKFSICR